MFMGVFELIIAPIVVGAIITLFAFWLKSREKQLGNYTRHHNNPSSTAIDEGLGEKCTWTYLYVNYSTTESLSKSDEPC